MSKTLFKTDSKGKVRILKLSTDGENLIQESGLETGKHTTTISKCVGKNIGRSNTRVRTRNRKTYDHYQ